MPPRHWEWVSSDGFSETYRLLEYLPDQYDNPDRDQQYKVIKQINVPYEVAALMIKRKLDVTFVGTSIIHPA